ncbi:MAG: hypothetical protein PHI98_13425 [Eubacteriales bacterium]|nr:hypothetical protein [Eubacteriales bacterium]
MKKILAIALSTLLVLSSCAALAEADATVLPMGANFGLSMDALQEKLGSDAQRDVWYEDDDESGALSFQNVKLDIGGLTANDIYFQVDRNNSSGDARLSMVSVDLLVDGSVIDAFKAALASLSEVYGTPDSDPFDDTSVEIYIEYGSLSATWTKADTRINLMMNRMYDQTLSLDYSYRLNYDAADLK